MSLKETSKLFEARIPSSPAQCDSCMATLTWWSALDPCAILTPAHVLLSSIKRQRRGVFQRWLLNVSED